MSPQTRNRIEFLVNLFYIAIIVALIYLGLKYALRLVLPFIVAFCIVSIVNPMIRFVIGKLRFSHGAASVAVMGLVYGAVGFLLFRLIMGLYSALKELFSALPAYYETSIGPSIRRTGAQLESLTGRLPGWAGDLEGTITSAVQSILVTVSQEGMSFVTGFTGQIPSFLIAFLFTIMLSFFIGAKYDEVTSFLGSQLPDSALRVATELKAIMSDIVLKYLGALFKLMIITFAELSVGLLALGIKGAIPIAVGIAVLDAIPFLGTGTILIPWALIELIQGNYPLALGLGLLYVIITVVRNVIEPHIVGQKLGMSPIVSIVSIYFGYRVFGFFGMIIMPMTTRILLELNNRGIIKLLRPMKADDISNE